ncbi:MAG: hypothetical protein V3R76_09230 [Gammaproteobacteria bacterium]
MNISTRALRQEVAHVSAPDGIDYSSFACVISGSDAAVYSRLEKVNHEISLGTFSRLREINQNSTFSVLR